MGTFFKCNKCGECCRNLHQSEIYEFLHDGDGICRYLKNNICTIYDNRPELCNIALCYEKYFNGVYTKEEYIALNEEGCKALWEKRKQKS